MTNNKGKDDFLENLKKTLKKSEMEKTQTTENGAVGFVTSGKAILDCNYKIPSYRTEDQGNIINDFKKAFNENPLYAVRWLFYAHDVRGGLGERRLFNILFAWLIANTPEEENIIPLLKLLPEYGRWDNLFPLLSDRKISIRYKKVIMDYIRETFHKDISNGLISQPVSLLGKWLPSETASNVGKKLLASFFMKELGLSPRQYRKACVSLRKLANVVEQKMTTGQWSEIDYSTVASKANLNYRDAFLRHDTLRRTQFLEKVEKGEAKINSGVVFPHEIVHQYYERSTNGWQEADVLSKIDSSLEEMWKALPNYELNNTLVVADGSGSMESTVGKTKVQALEIANALAIYCAEHNKGRFNNVYITFSSKPQLVTFADNSLMAKLNHMKRFNEVANTNIEAVFNLLLKTAITHETKAAEMPKNILIITDGEFDHMTDTTQAFKNSTLFECIGRKWEENGYDLPRLIFWNVNSRTNTIPVQENKNGVALVSGFSLSILKMVMSGELSAWKALKEVLDSPRYVGIQWRS